MIKHDYAITGTHNNKTSRDEYANDFYNDHKLHNVKILQRTKLLLTQNSMPKHF